MRLDCADDARHSGGHHFRGVRDAEACRERATEMLEFCGNEDDPAHVVFVEGRDAQASTVWPSEAATTQLFEDSQDYDVLQRASVVRKADSQPVCGGGTDGPQDCSRVRHAAQGAPGHGPGLPEAVQRRTRGARGSRSRRSGAPRCSGGAPRRSGPSASWATSRRSSTRCGRTCTSRTTGRWTGR